MSFDLVQGKCPACGREGMFVGAGGFVICSWASCPNPSAPSEALGVKFPAPPKKVPIDSDWDTIPPGTYETRPPKPPQLISPEDYTIDRESAVTFTYHPSFLSRVLHKRKP